MKKNLTQLKFKELKSIKRNQDIIIKPADKGSEIVIMDKQYYINEGIRQLSNTNFYEELPQDLAGKATQRINLYVHDMCSRGQITDQTANYLTTDIHRIQQFYFLPKNQKECNLPP